MVEGSLCSQERCEQCGCFGRGGFGFVSFRLDGGVEFQRTSRSSLVGGIGVGFDVCLGHSPSSRKFR